MSDRLRGRIGVVTGAGRGLGREIALALAAEGMSLALLARTGSEVRALAEHVTARFRVPAFPAAVDVTDAAAVDRVVMHVEQQLGTVDLLVNNAGQIEPAEVPFWQSDLDAVWRVVEVNLRGPLLLTRALLPPMVARGHGHVVNVTSRARTARRTGTYSGYVVSKTALSAFTASLAASLQGSGVVVLDVLPGRVRTAMTAGMPTLQGIEDGWDEAAASGRVVVDAALGHYDDCAGEQLDAPALDGANTVRPPDAAPSSG